MAKTFISVATVYLVVAAVFASTAKADSEAEKNNQNSTISTVALPSNPTAKEKPVETETKPKNEPKTTGNVGCKKFFPTVGMTLTVPCDAEPPVPAVAAKTPPNSTKEDSSSITEETPSSKQESTTSRKKSRSVNKDRKRRAPKSRAARRLKDCTRTVGPYGAYGNQYCNPAQQRQWDRR